MVERKPQSDVDFDRMLASLPVRRPPAELHERVLAQIRLIAQSPSDQNRLNWVRPIRAFRWERVLNVAVLLLVIAAPLSWLANLTFQDRMMTRLMGPTPADRQAQHADNSVHLADAGNEPDSQQNELANANATRDDEQSAVVRIHSLGYAGHLFAERAR